MNPAAPETPRKSRRLWWWLAAGLMLFASPFVFVGVAALSMLSLDRDAAALRREVVAATDTHWERKVQLSVGWVGLTAVRSGLAFVHDREHLDEARQALAAIRRASVGVYEHTGPAGGWTREQLFTRTDRMMQKRGWNRLVGVRDDHSTVLIYANEDLDPAGRIDLCLAVLDGDKLVVVSTRVEADKLLELAEKHLPEGGLRQKLKLAKI